MTNYILSPSDFSFLWEECKRCFYLKLVRKFNRPSSPFPNIFGIIDREMRAYFMWKETSAMTPDLPPGLMIFGEKWVHSAPIHLDGHPATCSIRGKLDAVLQFEDGSYGVIDFKTSDIKAVSLQLYARQLRAYAYALEHPAPGKFTLSPISHMGLLAFTPETYTAEGTTRSTLSGTLKWHAIQRNDEAFLSFLDEVLTVLELPEPPAADPGCEWCQYREASRVNGL